MENIITTKDCKIIDGKPPIELPAGFTIKSYRKTKYLTYHSATGVIGYVCDYDMVYNPETKEYLWAYNIYNYAHDKNDRLYGKRSCPVGAKIGNYTVIALHKSASSSGGYYYTPVLAEI